MSCKSRKHYTTERFREFSESTLELLSAQGDLLNLIFPSVHHPFHLAIHKPMNVALSHNPISRPRLPQNNGLATASQNCKNVSPLRLLFFPKIFIMRYPCKIALSSDSKSSPQSCSQPRSICRECIHSAYVLGILS
jgi:hypothetical protein